MTAPDAKRFRRLRSVRLAMLVLAGLGLWVLLTQTALWGAFLHWIVPGQPAVLYPSATPAQFALEHVELVALASVITVSVGILLGVAATRPGGRPFLPLISDAASLGQTFPPVAVLALAVPALGFGAAPAVVALVLYGLLPVLRNTIAGLEGISPAFLEAAVGMGMTRRQVLFKVELPLATRVIMAGIRTSVIITIGTATIAAAIGAGGLGVPIVGGLVAQNPAFILEGAIPVALLAILADSALGLLEVSLIPQGAR